MNTITLIVAGVPTAPITAPVMPERKLLLNFVVLPYSLKITFQKVRKNDTF